MSDPAALGVGGSRHQAIEHRGAINIVVPAAARRLYMPASTILRVRPLLPCFVSLSSPAGRLASSVICISFVAERSSHRHRGIGDDADIAPMGRHAEHRFISIDICSAFLARLSCHAYIFNAALEFVAASRRGFSRFHARICIAVNA